MENSILEYGLEISPRFTSLDDHEKWLKSEDVINTNNKFLSFISKISDDERLSGKMIRLLIEPNKNGFKMGEIVLNVLGNSEFLASNIKPQLGSDIAKVINLDDYRK